MTYVWGQSSQIKIAKLDPRMQAVLKKAITLVEIDMTIIEGLRSREQCFINFGRGRTPTECVAGGCPAHFSQPHLGKVTWLHKALSSNHYSENGIGKAVDLYPYPVSLVLNHKSGWEPLFDKIAKAMFEASKELAIPIRWGADWDMDHMPRERGETDNPHFELR
jgi:peptidoglycan L-alanyl-D-glutamate endopeptidase CwlK